MATPISYVVWDLETTGLDPKIDKAVELAFIVVKDNDIVEEFSSLIDVKIPIPSAASNIHGITNEDCEERGLMEDMVYSQLITKLNEYKYNVTHNGTKFDHLFLETYLGGDNPFMRYNIDTAAMFKAIQLNESRQYHESLYEFNDRILSMRVAGLRYNLTKICRDKHITVRGKAHRALTDVKMTAKLFKRLTS